MGTRTGPSFVSFPPSWGQTGQQEVVDITFSSLLEESPKSLSYCAVLPPSGVKCALQINCGLNETAHI